MRKSTIWVSYQVRHKPACTVSENTEKLEILDLSRRGIVAKTNALISCALTAQLICAFVFAQANCWFSDAVDHFIAFDQ